MMINAEDVEALAQRYDVIDMPNMAKWVRNIGEIYERFPQLQPHLLTQFQGAEDSIEMCERTNEWGRLYVDSQALLGALHFKPRAHSE